VWLLAMGDDPTPSWAVTKAMLIVASGFDSALTSASARLEGCLSITARVSRSDR
jgi:hypothetical protein